MDQHNEAEELAHLYVDGAFNRREMIRRARKIAGGVAAVSVALNEMGVPLKAAATCATDLRVPADAPDIEGADVQFAGEASPLFAYLVKPRRNATTPLPGVLVIHENRGLNEHIRDVARRVARAGYVALAIDLLSRQGGTSQFPNPTDAGTAYGRTTPDGRLADLRSSVAYLRSLPDVIADRIGTVGFCAGGGNAWLLAISGEPVVAIVIYYGAPVPSAEFVPDINGKLLCHYAELDRNLSITASGIVPALINTRRTFGFHVWEGVGHAFNNDTGAAFDQNVACQAWGQTLEFFARHLQPEAQG
jgi:carboxymethylenebutenolidase